MNNNKDYDRISLFNQTGIDSGRYLNPNDINIPSGYKVDIFAYGLDSPSSILFTPEGDLLIADSGYITGNPTVSRYVNDHFEVIANNFNVPLTGINYLEGNIYVSHKGVITIISKNGTRYDILSGLPSYGDYSNSRVAFGPDHKMYFGQGTATNSGVVGLDNLWVADNPYFHDHPGSHILLNGQNFETPNKHKYMNEVTFTGAFSPYGIPNTSPELRKGVTKASGSILKANYDGTDLKLVAWGLRNPSYLKFDQSCRLFVSNNSYNIRGSRPIANAPDEFHLLTPGVWYGWPDYAGGEPVTSAKFKPEGRKAPEFLFTHHPNIPPKPLAIFPPDSNILGFEFNSNPKFGPIGDVFVAEYGCNVPRAHGHSMPQYTGAGHRVSKIDMLTGSVSTFAINKTGLPATITQEGGFGRPTDICFGPDGAMYVVDMGTNLIDNPNIFIPKSGVIWRIDSA